MSLFFKWKVKVHLVEEDIVYETFQKTMVKNGNLQVDLIDVLLTAWISLFVWIFAFKNQTS